MSWCAFAHRLWRLHLVIVTHACPTRQRPPHGYSLDMVVPMAPLPPVHRHFVHPFPPVAEYPVATHISMSCIPPGPPPCPGGHPSPVSSPQGLVYGVTQQPKRQTVLGLAWASGLAWGRHSNLLRRKGLANRRMYTHVNSGSLPCALLCGDPLYHMLETPTFPSTILSTL